MKTNWFDVDRDGLAAIMERKGKAFAVFELIANSCDAGAKNISVSVKAVPDRPLAELDVEDDSTEGWDDLDHAFTMFARSNRAVDPSKRGRFNLGEKLVLSLATKARIETMSGCVAFDEDGTRRKVSAGARARGTWFWATIRMTRAELDEAIEVVSRMIPPAGVQIRLNGQIIHRPQPIATFETKLPTEIAGDDGVLRRSTRQTTVEAFTVGGGDEGDICELGIPVTKSDLPWRLNVLQKIPLNFERDNVTDAFRRSLAVAAVNALAETLTDEQATTSWATEAISDSRIAPMALSLVVTKRFGERTVIAVPGDPLANATAARNGYSVISGGALPGGAWANIRKNRTLVTTSAAFPTASAEDVAAAREAMPDQCPLCGQAIAKA